MTLTDRVKNIMVTPKTEWSVIAGEAEPPGTLISRYVVPLAGASAVAGFLGSTLVGITLPYFNTYRSAITLALVGAVVQFVMAIVAVYLLSMIVNALAPTFGAEKSERQAFKLAVYSCTPIWLAGILEIIPTLGFVNLLAAVYAIYLMYLGLTPLMKAPVDKAPGYALITAVCGLVLAVVIGLGVSIVAGVGILGNRLFGGLLF